MNTSANPFDAGKVLLIDKPLEWTSFDVVRKIRNAVRTKKVGHAGTLDPLATGLLIVCTGKFTKRINEFMAQEKEYTGTFTIGAVTPTYDLESDPEQQKDWTSISKEAVLNATIPFIGEIQQIPPAHSAIKVNGKRVYELARKGVEVKLEPRTITIKEFEITDIKDNVIGFRVVCTTGTYIRSLAQDFGQHLGVGAYLSSLRRTRIGDFSVTTAYTIDQAQAMITETLSMQ